MLSSIIRNGEWFWKSVRSDSLVEIQSQLPEIPIGTTDILVWNSSKGTYSCYESWNLLRLKFPVVDWLRVVWFPLTIARHSFILWLAVRDALTTKDKLCSWGFTSSSLCLFCYGCQESKDHLFFECSFGCRIWRALMFDCFVDDPPVQWDAVIHWFIERVRGKSLKTCLCKLCLGATVYHLWKQRNDVGIA
jgi:hypothetical protein